MHFWWNDQDLLHLFVWLGFANKDSGRWGSGSAADKLVTHKAYVRQADSSTAGEGLVGSCFFCSNLFSSVLTLHMKGVCKGVGQIDCASLDLTVGCLHWPLVVDATSGEDLF